ncbi:MAG: S-formylglutathione hydrolase, partial [Gammaproteobacteria bacterium]
LACDMQFTVFVPPETRRAPLLWWLSGLTCTPENFTVKAGAYRQAAARGLAVVAPDTSPRGPQVPDSERYDLGQGAGFYVDATVEPWSRHYRMYSYISDELNELVCREFPVDAGAQGISGHSMGGHGALVLGLRNPRRYRSLSAFAPIVAPSRVPWGQQAFGAYLGEDRDAWARYDATELMQAAGDRSAAAPILVDQGEADEFLTEQLRPGLFAAACDRVGQPLELRYQPGYDHSYFFVSTFIAEHIDHHARLLRS